MYVFVCMYEVGGGFVNTNQCICAMLSCSLFLLFYACSDLLPPATLYSTLLHVHFLGSVSLSDVLVVGGSGDGPS
jgi:hypothetical protein